MEHSRSPELHGAMLELAGLEGEYLKVRADRYKLAKAIEDLRSGRWSGINVTMPLKSEAARLADSLSPRAARSRSVNTLAHRDSVILGDSTDSTAFAELIASERFRGISSILVLGAGGSAAAALSAMPAGANVYLEARRMSQAEQVAGRLGGEVLSWGTAVAGALVINTTPLGMGGEDLPYRVLETAGGLIDLPYGTDTTPSVLVAAERGLPHADGHEFLLRQAIASFAMWTGIQIELETLENAVRKP